ncbi:MAG: geranylgeranylglycerol-phosphate geranylgeranyltransferase [Bacteroidota bacterium]
MEYKTGFHMIHLLRLIRWPNLVIVMITQCMVMYLIIGRVYAHSGISPAMEILPFLALVLTTVIIAAAGYIINDYFDIRTDRINKPDAVVVGKYLPRRKAIKLHIILNSIAIAAGFIISWKVGSFRLGIIFPLMITLLWFYSERYKRTILTGNLSVALMTAMVVLVVWLFEFFALKSDPAKFMAVYTMLGLINRIVLSYSLFAFLLTMIREIIKDAEDIEGDASTGCRTLPVVYGIRSSGNLASTLLLIASLLVVAGCIYLFNHAMPVPSAYFGLVVCLPMLYILFKAFRAESKADFHKISKLIKLIMLAGILGMMLLAIYL